MDNSWFGLETLSPNDLNNRSLLILSMDTITYGAKYQWCVTHWLSHRKWVCHGFYGHCGFSHNEPGCCMMLVLHVCRRKRICWGFVSFARTYDILGHCTFLPPVHRNLELMSMWWEQSLFTHMFGLEYSWLHCRDIQFYRYILVHRHWSND